MTTKNNEIGFTKKQMSFLRKKGKRLNFLVGSVRSGITWVSLWKWVFEVASAPKGYEFIMIGKTLMSLKRNCLSHLETFVGSRNFSYSLNSKTAFLFGHKVHLEGANDERAEGKIRGMTLAGAYCDEITLFPENFFVMLLTRLSMPNAKLWATCNPDSPNHWVKVNYLDNSELMDTAIWNFILTDNTFLDKDYIENIQKEFVGVFYNRFILGQWVRAEGVIYSVFANNPENFFVPNDFDYSKIVYMTYGVDFGGSKSATTFVCTGFTKGFRDVIILEAERHEQELSPDKLEELFSSFVKRCFETYKKSAYTYADSAEQILIRGLRNVVARERLTTMVKNARKSPVKDRILAVNRLINTGRFWVNKHCKTVIKALQDAVWNEDKEDERLDDFTSDIDTLDAMEYSIEPFFGELSRI